METQAPIGLRDKKRIETRSRLERAALDLVVRVGLAHTTIDAISEAAEVSPRTFFNYFDSKEDAILGVRDVELTNEVVARHVAEYAGVDIVESVVRLLFGVIGPSMNSGDLRTLRMQVVQDHPELLGRHVTQMTRMADQITAAIQTLLKTDDAFADDPDLRASADVLFALCGGGVRTAVREWVGAGSSTPIDNLQQRAITLVREVTKRLQ